MPVLVGDPERCKLATGILFEEHGFYIQPTDDPTVPHTKEC